MKESEVRLGVPVRGERGVRWTGEFVPATGHAAPIWFELHGPEGSLPEPTPRPFLLAALVPAMRVGAPLRVAGPVDATTISNLMEWQEAFAAWHPGRLVPVPIRCDVRPSPPHAAGRGGALTAFSGGVDSCFTAIRHTSPPAEPTYRSTPLAAGLMVHGFDVPLDRSDEFEGAWTRSHALLEAFGLRPLRLATNVRTLERAFGCDWEEDSHGIWLAAALACHESAFERVLIPSTYAYPMLKFPWASNPITDPLLGSDAVELRHDGAIGNKLSKVRAIAGSEAVRRHLRVCWQGERLDRNCGHCFKCLATQACFWLAGVASLPAFPDPGSVEEVARMPVKNEQNAWLVAEMRDEALAQGRADLARSLTAALANGPSAAGAARPRGLLRRWFSR